MNTFGSPKFIERVRFFDNERLIAPDLQAIDDFARQMRWLHNRSLHQLASRAVLPLPARREIGR